MNKIKAITIAFALLLFNMQTTLFATALHEACRKGKIKKVKKLIKKSRKDINTKDSDLGNTPLITTVQENHSDIVAYLLTLDDIDTNLKNHEGNTALHLAVQNNNQKIVVQLLAIENNIDLTIANNSGDTAFEIACEYEHHEIAKIIDKEMEEEQIKEIFDKACERKKLPTIMCLFDHCKYKMKKEHIEIVCKHGDREALVYLAEKAPIFEIDLKQMLLDACKNGWIEIVQQFIETLEFDVELQDKELNTLLHIACDNSKPHIVECLLKNNANPKTLDKNGKTPLDKAMQLGNEDVIRKLLEKRKDLLHTYNKKGHFPVHSACDYAKSHTDTRILKLLVLNFKASINTLSKTVYQSHNNRINILEQTRFTPLEIAEKKYGKSSWCNYITGYLTNKRKEQIKTLFEACKEGDFEKVRNYIEELEYYTILTELKDSSENTLLHVACQNGHLEIVQYLVQNGAEVNARNNQKDTPLALACPGRHTDIVKFLMQNGANIDTVNQEGDSPLAIACKHGSLSIVEHLVKNEAKLDTLNLTRGNSPLAIACKEGHKNTVICLVKNDANRDSKNHDRNSPLALACLGKHIDIIKILLKEKAKPNTKNNDGNSPLALACQKGYKEIVEILLQEGANPDTINKEGNSPLAIACEKGDKEIVEILLQKNINPNTVNKAGDTPLIIATLQDDKDIVQLLLDKKANPEIYNKFGHSAQGLACANNLSDIADTILQHRSDLVNTNDDYGFNSLHYASWRGVLPLATLLVKKHKADIHAQSKNKKTAIILAKEEDHTEVFEFLKKQTIENPKSITKLEDIKLAPKKIII